jgi:fatty acid desaturase
MVPMVTVVAFIIRVRGMSEHNGLPLTIELNSSRTTLWPNPVIAYFMTPFYVNHHLEHHLYPQVPYFHLQKLHNELMKDPVFKERAAISNNYFKNLIKT